MLGSEAVDGAVLHAECGNATALSSLHHQVQGKVLYEIVAVVAEGLRVMVVEGGGGRV